MTTLPPEEYIQSLSKIELKNLIFSEISAKFLAKNYTGGEINLSIQNESGYERENDSNNYRGKDKYVIEGTMNSKSVMHIELELLVSFQCTEPIEDEFIKQFEEDILKIITYPYMRNAVQDLTAKMGLPPLILPLWKRMAATKEVQASVIKQ